MYNILMNSYQFDNRVSNSFSFSVTVLRLSHSMLKKLGVIYESILNKTADMRHPRMVVYIKSLYFGFNKIKYFS